MTVTRPTPADEELMVAYREGDEQAFALLFERYKTRLFNYFFRHLGIRAVADDLLQSTFLKVHRSRKSYQPTAAFSTWIFTIASNLLKDAYQAQRRRAEVVSLDKTMEHVVGSTQTVPSSFEEDLETTYAVTEINHRIRDAVQSLPCDQRAVILLSKYEGLKYEEIAAILHTTVGAVKVRAHRAMKTLKKALQEQLDSD